MGGGCGEGDKTPRRARGRGVKGREGKEGEGREGEGRGGECNVYKTLCRRQYRTDVYNIKTYNY